MRHALFPIYMAVAACALPITGVSSALAQDHSRLNLRGTQHVTAKEAHSITIYAGPETVPPNDEIHIFVEVQTVGGESAKDGVIVSLTHYGVEGIQILKATTEFGLAAFEIPSGDISGDKLFIARSIGGASEEVSVNVTSGRLNDIPVKLSFDKIANELIVEAGVIKDMFGNVPEDGSVITLATETASGNMAYETAILIRGTARWSLPCRRYPSGLLGLSLTIKDAVKTVILKAQNCPVDGRNLKTGV